MKLVIGTLSTWSLRAWMCGQLAKIECEIHAIDLSKNGYKAEVLKYSPTGLVPALTVEDLVIHDSLAITEYFNEKSNGSLYPESSLERALARSLCMEMHSGFMNLRSQCPFSLEAVSPLMDRSEGIQKELDRVSVVFQQARLPFMFDNAGAVDVFYAVLAYRLKSYGIEFKGVAGEYQKSLLKWPLLEKAIKLSTSL